MRGHRGYNICPWLKNGKREICGKSCREEYCKVHRFKIRNGSKIPRPCLGCGIGIRSEIQLCRGCGREKERQRLAKQEQLARLPRLFTHGWMESTPWPPTPPSKHRARAESPNGRSLKPTMCMINDELCFGMRD